MKLRSRLEGGQSKLGSVAFSDHVESGAELKGVHVLSSLIIIFCFAVVHKSKRWRLNGETVRLRSMMQTQNRRLPSTDSLDGSNESTPIGRPTPQIAFDCKVTLSLLPLLDRYTDASLRFKIDLHFTFSACEPHNLVGPRFCNVVVDEHTHMRPTEFRVVRMERALVSMVGEGT